MAPQIIRNVSNRLLIIIAFIFAIYSNARLIATNYALNQAVIEKKAELGELEEDSAKLKLLLGYYQSDEYQEVEARRRLGLKKSDERAYAIKGLILPISKPNEIEPVIFKELPQEAPVKESNLSAWWKYFFN
ncbi:septum formation initiator family protein [Candidatus Berkelbacteria bacterium]|nr:septum formation initiator family protein [Candidatus Berkelbacteria bacterium]